MLSLSRRVSMHFNHAYFKILVDRASIPYKLFNINEPHDAIHALPCNIFYIIKLLL